MEIVVLLKRVPATESFITVADGGTQVRTEELNWVMNPYDEFAVEEALRIKEKHGGSVTLVSVGPDKTTETLRTGLAMGADAGILVNDPAALNLDNLGTARVLAAAVKQIPFDLVIAGQRAVDDEGFTVGTAVAEFLDIASINLVVKADIADRELTCVRTVEGGTVTLKTALPALFTTQRGLNEPRYASLPGVMKAKKKSIPTKSLADLGLDVAALGPAKVIVTAMAPPPERSGGRIIAGESVQDKVAGLIKALREEAKVI